MKLEDDAVPEEQPVSVDPYGTVEPEPVFVSMDAIMDFVQPEVDRRVEATLAEAFFSIQHAPHIA